jgi:CheY-like chemotaxis protein
LACVLSIDDDVQGLALRKAVLEHAGHKVLIAVDAESGLELVKASSVDAVLLDYRLNGMSAEEFVALLKQAKPGLPVIILSGVIERDHPIMESADYYVSKSDGPEALIHTLAQALPAF